MNGPIPQIDGKALRDRVSRSAQSAWQPNSDRPDPIDLLEASNVGRLPQLVPIRYGRMLKSPFTFLRGAAIVMAADLATTPTTGVQVQACGDCHLLNFGGYGTPERNLVFDVNDFDETLPAPWEWDLKRLAASIVVAGRHINLAAAKSEMAAQAAVCAYREHMGEYAQMNPLDVWYARIDADRLRDFGHDVGGRQRIDQQIEKALTRSSAQALSKLTVVVNGQRQIIDNPPLVYHLPTHDRLTQEVESVFQHYRETLRDDLHMLLDRYQLVDLAIKVVGVGSVGTRCAIALFMAAGQHPLFLQFKEARTSVLAPYAGQSHYENQGQRIVAGQRLMQAASDLFLGWTCSDVPGEPESGHDFYVRQLRDMKISIDIEKLSAAGLVDYATLCGWALALSHARSGNPALISGYLGKRSVFDQAIASFAIAYADQTERDYQALVEAVKSGRIEAIDG